MNNGIKRINKNFGIRFLMGICLLMLCACSLINLTDLSISTRKPAANKEEPSLPLEVFKKNLVSEYDPILDEFPGATFYSIKLTLAEDISQISGHLDVQYFNSEPMPLDRIYFKLIPNSGGDFLNVKNIKVKGKPVAGVLEHKNTSLKINLPESLQPGEAINISMDFSESVPLKMSGNYGLYIYQDKILALDSFFPIIPVYDEKGWGVQNPPKNADMIFTDAAFFEVQIDAPDDLVLAASGVEVDKVKAKDRQIVTFAGGPQRDFYMSASPKYQQYNQYMNEVKVTSYFPEEYPESGDLVLETAVNALQVFSERYGLYPYTEFDLASTPMQAGGMEYSGAAAMALGLYPAGITASGSPNSVFLEYATAHEVAHQWFFNQVMNDQINEPWLDEGLAQYLTYIYYLDTYGSTAGEQVKASWERYWSAVDMDPIPIGKPAEYYDSDEYASIIYGRAPFFILELEKKMGAKTFTRFLAEYVELYRWKTVDSQQFKSLAEEYCSCDLDNIFNEWGVLN